MTTLKQSKFILIALASVFFLQACKKPKKDLDIPDLSLQSKVYVLNEGAFGVGNSSVSIYDPLYKKVYNDLFEGANGRALGDVLQSMCLVNDKAYFVVNGSNKIEITQSYPLTSIGVITGLTSPRYMLALNNDKAYVSEWLGDIDSDNKADGRISIVNLASNTVSSTISISGSPEAMAVSNNKVYVGNVSDTTVAVINPTTNAIEKYIKVPGAPTYVITDNNGMVWVYCFGDIYNPDYSYNSDKSTNAALVKINPTTNTVVSTFFFSSSTYSGRITTNKAKDQLYYYFGDKVYTMGSTATSLSSTPIISRSIYGLGIDPLDNTIYVGSYGFSSNQRLVRYTSSGSPIDSAEVGVGPNSFIFNY